MEAPSTPPRTTPHLDVPPTPTYGTLLDHWEPHPTRRSSRVNSNPYSTPKVTNSNTPRAVSNHLIPTTSLFSSTTKPTLGFTLNDVLSPPSSPMSNAAGSRDNSTVNNLNLNGKLEPRTSVAQPSALFPTPAKTPSMTPARKHQRTASMQSTARVLPFQPEHPNDAMPTRRENRKVNGRRAGDLGLGLEDYADDQNNSNPGFQIYTECHARVPEKDESLANPFYGPSTAKKNKSRSDSDSPEDSRPEKTAEVRAEEANIVRAASRDEGLIYNFRGRKVFRKFEDGPDDSDDSDPGATRNQLALKRAVGASASRPITRSAIVPRLLFQSYDSGYGASEDVDEEAETDVEMVEAEPMESAAVTATPAKTKSAPQQMLSPPTTKRTLRNYDVEHESAPKEDFSSPARRSRSKKAEVSPLPISQDDEGSSPEPIPAALPTPARSSRKKKIETDLTPVIEEEDSPAVPDTTPGPAFPAGSRKNRSPFDNWPRTKSGTKRGSEPLEGADTPAKRTRSTNRLTPA